MGEVKGINLDLKQNNVIESFIKSSDTVVKEMKENVEKYDQKVEELALEEDKVITDIAEGDVASSDFFERIKEQDPDLADCHSQLEGVNSLLQNYNSQIANKPDDFESMKEKYENAINSTIHYSNKEGYVVSVDETKQKEIIAEYKEYAKSHGYSDMKEMIDFYNTVDDAKRELKACKRVLNRQIDCKVNLIDYTCKYGLLAEKESYQKSGKISSFHMMGSTYLVYENNDADPLQKHIDACNAGYGNFSDASQEIIELYEASQNDESLGQMYQYIYKTEGMEAAKKYLDDLAPYIRQSAAVYEANEFMDSIKNDGDLERNLKELGIGFDDGVNSFFQGLTNLADPLEDFTTLDYKKTYILYALTNNEEYSELCYEFGLGAGNLTIPLAVGLLVPGGGGALAGGLLSGASVAGNTTHSCLVNGMDLNTARAKGNFAGAVDTATWILAGKLNKLCKANFSQTWAQFTLSNAGMAGSLGATTFFVQVNEKADQLLKTGDYYKRFPNNMAAAKNAAYNDAYEALGGDIGLLKKVGFAAGAGGIVGGLSYGKVKADEDISAGGANVSKAPVTGAESVSSKAATAESGSVVSEVEAGAVGSDFVISEVQLDTASSILSYIKSMNSSADSNHEEEK